MPIFMLYAFVGPYLWVAQVVVVITLSALGWRSPSPEWPALLQGRTASSVATAIAAVFTVLMVPVAIMVALRRHQRDFPTSWTDPPGLACILQLVLLAAAGVNAFAIHHRAP
ncbi:Hypothetical protein A7982_02986 [Minicystis rosea]|nr:Hypothetical protein A7982_02986 [Minicystis rosea]